MDNRPSALSLHGVTKSYNGTDAVKGVSIEIRPREVVGLIGENGAGKSTLLKILTGIEQPTSGTLCLRGAEVALNGVRGANRHGIAMVFQEQSLIGTVSAGENVLLGHEGQAVTGGVYRWGALRRNAQEYLDMVGADVRADEPTSGLSFAERQMVEVAKALASAESEDHEPVILLDEPTSVLEAQEIERLFGVVDELRERASVVFVSHRMEEVLRVCDRVYVLRDGAVVGERDPKAVEEDELFSLMVGEDLSEGFYHESRQAPPRPGSRLELRGLNGPGFRDIDLDVAPGEVVALMGVQGSGREEVARAVFGAVPISAGSMRVDGQRFTPRSPSQAVRHSIGYVPSDRKTDGAVLGMSLQDNMVLAHPGQVSFCGLQAPVRQLRTVEDWAERLRIKASSVLAPLRNLSGGNQQKVVLAKWLLDPDLRVLMLETPTRGLDVGAKSDVYSLIRELASRGLAVVLLADTLEEGIHMSHRVVTLRDGRISGEFPCAPNRLPERTDILGRMI